MKLYILETDETNPFQNLAMERYLTLHAGPGSLILYLWQNDNTVVIGKNQNYRTECNISEIKAGAGKITRRLSGGGAVYHDLGNLNFSFITARDFYSVDRQLKVITDAVNDLGLPLKAERTGRNDIQIDGAKFSGNAFLNGENCCHHGTILISTDFDRLSRYLKVPDEKLKAKGVKSVRSRVVNLSALGEVSITGMKKVLYAAFEREYRAVAETFEQVTIDENELSSLYDFFSSTNWINNEYRMMQYRVSTQFSWGRLEMGFNVDNGQICEIQVFTDALDEELSKRIKNALLGRIFSTEAFAAAGGCQELDDAYELVRSRCFSEVPV